MRPSIRVITVVASAVLLVTSCSRVPASSPVSATADPSSVGGMPALNGKTTVGNVRPESTREVTNTHGGPIDRLATDSVTDVEQFWADAYPQTFDGQFAPVKELVSWDSLSDAPGEYCGTAYKDYYNAAYCADRSGMTWIGWDRGALLPDLRGANGDIAVTTVLAHEYGHAIQYQAGTVDENTPTVVSEQQADCFAGVYMRWVTEGKSKRVTLSTGDGLNNVMAAIIAVRDPVGTEAQADPENEHGSAFDRLAAFQYGFEGGAKECKGINERELYQRRADLPQFLPDDQSGQMDITKESVQQLIDALNVVSDPKDPPKLSFDTKACPDSDSTDAAIYCASTNTIVANLPALQAMTVTPEKVAFRGPAVGDLTAFSAVMSRYMMALENEHGAEPTGTQAALRTACLTGFATTKFVNPVETPDGGYLQLSAGDLDEAVSGLLSYGVVASDADGAPVPAGFARIEAFREGVLGDSDHCYELFS